MHRIRDYLGLLFDTDDEQKVRSIQLRSGADRSWNWQVGGGRGGIDYCRKVNHYGKQRPYLPHLKKTLYRHQKTVLGYGIKLWPEDFVTLKTKAPETASLEGLLN